MYKNVSVSYCPFYRPFHYQISAHRITRFTNNATGLIPPLSLCREAGGNICSCRDVTLSPCYETNRESRGTHSCFLLRDASAPSQHLTASHLHRSPSANWPKSNGPVSPGPRVANGTAVHVRPLSPRPGKCLLPCHLNRREGELSPGRWTLAWLA